MISTELIKIADKIEIPRFNKVGLMFLDSDQLANLFGIKEDLGQTYYINFETGKVESSKSKRDIIMDFNKIEIPRFNALYGDKQRKKFILWFDYLQKYNATFVGLYSIYNGKLKGEGDVRNFTLEDYYFITEDKMFVYKEDECWKATNDREVASRELPFSYLDAEEESGSFENAMLKQFGVFREGSHYVHIDTARSLSNHMFYNRPSSESTEKVSTKLKDLTDEVLALPLKSLEYSTTNYKIPLHVAKLEQVNKDVSVIRWFIHEPESKENYEYMRYYVTDKENFLCEIRTDKKFHPITKHILKDDMVTNDFIMNKDELKESVFRYFFDMIEQYELSKRAYSLYEITRFSLLEKFAKTGLPAIVHKSLKEYLRGKKKPYTTIGNIFGVKISDKETDIYKALGFNKYQYKKFVELFQKASQHWDGSYLETEAIRLIRCFLKGNEYAAINDIDNNTFDIAFEVICDKKDYWYTTNHLSDCLRRAYEIYSLDTRITILKAAKVFSRSIRSYAIGNNNSFYHLCDYVEMVYKMKDAKHFPVKFSDPNSPEKMGKEIKAMHDAAIPVYNLIKYDVQMKDFEKQTKKWTKWEYKGERFSVVSPKVPGDIAQEGLELHHCVKSYIDRVVEGRTNILFIRNTDNIDKPFFTVEISNSGALEQIHGFGNRNSSTEPGLDEFITEWTKAKKLKKSDFNKIRA